MHGQGISVALVGATGAVGREVLAILEAREVPVSRLELFASIRSGGLDAMFQGRPLVVNTLTPGCFQGSDVVIGATSEAVAREWVPQAVKEGATVIDNSSAFRMEPGIPLVVPEVNPGAVAGAVERGIIANPNCSTIQLVVAVAPLHRVAGIERMVVSTYQSVSGTGQRGMNELSAEVLDLFRQGAGAEKRPSDGEQERELSPFPHSIAFNAIPHIGSFLPDGTTTEERKMRDESRKIMAHPKLQVCVTCVRVPWFACHALSVNLEMARDISDEEARQVLSDAPGVVIEDEPENNVYPMPFVHAGSDSVYIGRIRQDTTVPRGLALWIVADNLRKGAALNAVQILECLLERRHWTAT